MSYLISLFKPCPYETVKVFDDGHEEVTIYPNPPPLSQKVCRIALAIFVSIGIAQVFLGVFPWAWAVSPVVLPFVLWPDSSSMQMHRGGRYGENHVLKQIEDGIPNLKTIYL